MKRSLTDTRRPGQWDIPGGHVDAGEYAEEAAARETLEEATIIIDSHVLHLVATRTETVTGDLVAHWLFYAADIKGSQPVVTLSSEHDDYRWVSHTEALELITYDIQHKALAYALTSDQLPL